MANLPVSKEGLEAAGYLFSNDAYCRGCGQPIEWWITPNNKRMPFRVVEVKDESKPFPQPLLRLERIPHFADCLNVKDFRRNE